MEPDTYIDITGYMDVKIEALKQHASQWVSWEIDEDDSTATLDEVVERVRHKARQRGLESGVTYAEAFISQYGRKSALDLFQKR